MSCQASALPIELTWQTIIVSIALLISSAWGAIWLNPFATVSCSVCLLLCKEEGSFPVSAITEKRDMGLYEVHICVALCFKHASPRGYYVF